ncbi:MAG: DUF2180 family protein [Methanosphaera stadtmanae]|nr:DUF2180 family protein [Methanosphaera stadtmanae]
MKCYMCSLEGKETEAVAICIVCGMGLCEDHIVREEIELWTGGYPFPSEKLDQTLPRILCRQCYEALKASQK